MIMNINLVELGRKSRSLLLSINLSMANDILKVQKVATKEIIERSIMVSKNFKVLEVINNNEFVFSSYSFKNEIKRYALNQTTPDYKVTTSKIKTKLASKLCVSEEAIKNWVCGYNGPSDIEVVKMMAEFFGIDYLNLLRKKETNDMENNTNKENTTISISHETKAVIRTVYQRIAALWDDIVAELPYDFGGEDQFHVYEKRAEDLVFLLHQNMLDIPTEIYSKLMSIVTEDFDYYLHGNEEGGFTVWEETEYCQICEQHSQEMYALEPMCIYMKKMSDEFYENIREILKNYITA